MKEIKDKIEEVFKEFPDIKVDEFKFVIEALTELFEAETERAIQIDRDIQGQEWYKLFEAEKQKMVEEILPIDNLVEGKDAGTEYGEGYSNGFKSCLKVLNQRIKK